MQPTVSSQNLPAPFIGETASRDIFVRAFPNPLHDEFIEARVSSGQTIAEIIGSSDIPAICIADGRVIECEFWEHVKPLETLDIRRIPAGGDTARMIGQIAILAAAIYLAPLAGFGAFGTALLTAGIGIAGSLALNALIPPPKLPGAPGEADRLSFLTGQSNQVAAFSPIPVVYGRMRYFPPVPMTGLPYTELVGKDQYFRALFVLGYGPLEIGGVSTASGVITQSTTLSGNPIRIADTPISQFSNYEFQIGTPAQCTLFTNSVVEEQVNVSVPRNDATTPSGENRWYADNLTYTRTTDNDADEVSLDVFFPQLFSVNENNGKTRWAKVQFQVDCRVAGSSDSWTLLDSNWEIGSVERNPIRVGRRYVLPSRGQWEIRLTRVRTMIAKPDAWYTDAVWTTLRTIKRNVRPFDVDNVVVMAIRIKATDQLGGRLERLSIDATRILPVWNGSAWVNQATRNPAWAYVDVLTGLATNNAIPKSRVDTTTVKAWADWCVAEGLYCDTVIDANGTVFDRAREIASTGLGSWHVSDDGSISIIRDEVSDSKALISPRNSWGFGHEYTYPDIPHALRVQFTDPDRWELTERLVFSDGYTSANATKFEQLQLFGVTDPDQAWKIGRFHLAQLTLRPEQYSWNQDIGHLIASRGECVDLSHDTILVGIRWGRIKSISGVNLVVDEFLPMLTGTNYGLRIQRQDGTLVTQQVTTISGGTFSPSLTASVSGLNVGDHFVFGELGSEIIKTKIISVHPSGGFKAQVTAVPAADNIYNAWSGSIPAFDPVITSPIEINRVPPPKPVIVNLAADFGTSVPDADGASRVRIAVTYSMPPGLSGVWVEARFRRIETLEIDSVEEDLFSEWAYGGEVPSDSGVLFIGDVEELLEYEVQLRSVRGESVSDWTDSQTVYVDDFNQFRVTSVVSYNRQNTWRRAPNNGAWTPVETTVDGTVTFLGPGTTLAARTIRATLNTTEGTITVADQSSSGENTTFSPAGSGTGSVSVSVTHTASGVSGVLNFVSVLSGADGTSVTILGTKASVDDLPSSGNTVGDGWIVDGDLWVWDGTAWNNVGPIQGPSGDDGLSVAELVIYRRSATAPATPTGGSFDFGTQILTPPTNWSAGIPSGTDPVYASRAVAAIIGQTGSFSSFTWTSPVKVFEDGEDGVNGKSVDIIFRRSATQPATPAASSGVPSGWYSNVNSVPASSDPLWSAVGTRDNPTDNWTWQTPIRVEGAQGTPGINSAPVLIYRRSSASPATPSVTATYTFATGAITGLNNSWSATIPAANGNPLWVSHASASATGATDTIDPGEWSAPQKMAEDGAAGGNTALVYLYQRAVSAPGAPTGSLTYTFATGVLSGTPGGGWSITIPAANGNPLWIRTAVAFGSGATDTIAPAEWSASVKLVEDGVKGDPGDQGEPGQPAVWIEITRSAVTLFAYANGGIESFDDANGLLKVWRGSEDVTASATLSASASGCTGTINTSTNTPVNGQPKGYYRVTAMSADTATLTLTATYNSIQYQAIFSLAKAKAGYEIVASLPVSNLFAGRMVFLTTDNKLYRYTGSAWTAAVPATDVTGQLTDAQLQAIAAAKVTGTITSEQIANGSISGTKFASGLTPVEIVASLPVSGNFEGRVVVLTTDDKLYRYTGSAWTAAVPTADLTGTISTSQIAANAIDASKFASGVRPVEIVSSLPGSGNFAGRVVFLTTDNKLYRHTGSAWTAAIPSGDISGQLADAQIAALAASKITGQLTDAQIQAITAAKVSGQLTDAQIQAISAAKVSGTLTDAQIASLSTAKLTGTITNTQIADDAITTPKISAGAITTNKLAANSVTADQIAANSIVSGKIAAGSVSTTELAALSVTAEKIGAAAVTTAKLSAGAVVADTIAANAVTAVKIQAGAVESAKIAAGAIDAGKISAGAVTADKISANAVTTDKISANAVTAGKVAAGAIGADQILANSILASKLVVSDQNNIYPDFDLEDVAFYTSDGVITFSNTTSVNMGRRFLSLGADSVEREVVTGWFPVERLSPYRAEGSLFGSGTDSTQTLYIEFGALSTTGGLPVVTPLRRELVGQRINSTATGIFSIEVSTQSSEKRARFAMVRDAGGTSLARMGGLRLTRRMNAQLIVDGAITADKITTNAVTSDKISANAITAVKIASNAITTAKLDANSVTAAKVAAGAITATQLAASAVTADKIAANAVTAVKIAAGSIETAKLAAGAVTADTIAANAITTPKIQVGAIDANKLAVNSVTADAIAAGQITAAKLATTELITLSAQIKDGIITNAKIANLDADKITTGILNAGRINLDGLTLENSGGQLQIRNEGVSTVKVAEHAITKSESEFVPGITTLSLTSFVNLATLTYVSTGVPTLVTLQSMVLSASGSTSGTHIRLMRGATVLWSTEATGEPTSKYIQTQGNDLQTVSGVIETTFPAGSVTLTLQGRRVGSNSSQALYRSISVLELKR